MRGEIWTCPIQALPSRMIALVISNVKLRRLVIKKEAVFAASSLLWFVFVFNNYSSTTAGANVKVPRSEIIPNLTGTSATVLTAKPEVESGSAITV